MIYIKNSISFGDLMFGTSSIKERRRYYREEWSEKDLPDFISDGITKRPADAAKVLYTGMVTDSGRFRYDSTTAQTFRLTSFLMERKFDLTDVYSNL